MEEKKADEKKMKEKTYAKPKVVETKVEGEKAKMHNEKDVKKVEEKIEKKAEEKKETKTEAKVENKIMKKEEAIAKGNDLPLSKKHCMYICDFIKGKKIDDAIKDLQEVIKLKKVVPFKGEIPHRKGPGMMSGRYPVKASGHFINLLKALKGNAIVNGLDIDNTKISFGMSNDASRPARRGGRKFKRAHVVLKAKEFGMTDKMEAKK